MEMKRINAGKLRAIGYDRRERILRDALDALVKPPGDAPEDQS